MSLLDDRLSAIRRIEESVYGRLQEGRRPKQLAKELFDLLRQAVERGAYKGGQLSRATAARDLDTQTTSTSFKTSIDRIAEELRRCRPDDAREMPADEDCSGVACVEAFLGGTPHLVFVRGPRGSHRGDPTDQLLRLEAEFRPIAPRHGLPVVAENETPASTEKPHTSESRPPERRSPIRVWITTALVLMIVAISAAWGLFQRSQSPDRGFSIHYIPAETASYYDAWGGRVAPDGNRVAFLARAPSSGKRFIFVQELVSDEEANAIEDNAGDFTSFFWSHDGKSLYFVTGGFLKRKPIGQKAIQTIARIDGAPRGTVNQDGVVLLSSSKGILQVLPDGRKSQITISRTESAHTAPYFLPDGLTFLFLAISHRPGGAVKTLCSGRIDAPHRIRRIAPISSRVEWNADHLLYARDGALYARPWSLGKQSFAGNELLVTRRVWSNASTSDADFSVARNGLLIVKDAASRSRFERVRPGTKSIPIRWQRQVVGITVARDRELAVLASYLTPGRTDLWVWDLKDDPQRKLTSFGTNTSPVLNNTGDEVYYAANRENFASIYRMSIATGAETLVLAGGDSALGPRGLSSDGELLLYASNRPQDTDLYCINLKTRQVIPIANSPKAMEGETGRFSPDGTQVVYASDVSGDRLVYIAPFPPDGAPVRPISPPGGWRARWSYDGKKIYYLLRRSIMEFDVLTNAERELYRADSDSDISHMEPAAHDEFLVVVAPIEPPNRIVSNWQQAVRVKK